MDSPKQFHLETAVTVLTSGRSAFEDLVTGSDDLLVENLYALEVEPLREIVFERVVAERARRSGQE
jgi:hypothetical protein